MATFGFVGDDTCSRARVASQAPSKLQGLRALARPNVDQTAIGSRPPSAMATLSLPDMPSVLDSEVFDILEPLPDVEHWILQATAGRDGLKGEPP